MFILLYTSCVLGQRRGTDPVRAPSPRKQKVQYSYVKFINRSRRIVKVGS